MAFFSYFQCTAHKTERFPVQKATNGASFTLQAIGGSNLNQTTDMRQIAQLLIDPGATDARWTARKQEPDGSPFYSASSVS